jgi:prevent-host-death family protein
MPRTYSVYEAKTKLSELLRIVKSGAEVVVMERGKPIAKVVPLKDQSNLQTRLESLEEQGLLISGNGKDFPEPGKKISGGLERFLKDR